MKAPKVALLAALGGLCVAGLIAADRANKTGTRPAPSAVAPQEREPRREAWGKTWWGMSAADLAAAYPDAVLRTKARYEAKVQAAGERGVIAEFAFTEGDSLLFVTLRFQEQRGDDCLPLADAVIGGLYKKYGNPVALDRRAGSISFRSETTGVTASCEAVGRMRHQLVLRYEDGRLRGWQQEARSRDAESRARGL